MPRRRKQPNDRISKDKSIQTKNEIAQKTTRGIILLLSFLIIPCAILIFKIGESLYSTWINTHRAQIIGLLLFIIVVVIVSSPLVVEVNSNPRQLSGPGKNPKTDLWK